MTIGMSRNDSELLSFVIACESYSYEVCSSFYYITINMDIECYAILIGSLKQLVVKELISIRKFRHFSMVPEIQF